MSMSGCAVTLGSLTPRLEVEVILKVVLMLESDHSETFNIKGRIVRVANDSFGDEFTELDNERKKLVWKCLLRESQR